MYEQDWKQNPTTIKLDQNARIGIEEKILGKHGPIVFHYQLIIVLIK